MNRGKEKTVTENDEALVGLIRQGDRMAFEELVQRYQSKVYRLVMGVLQDHQDAEEVLQETFLRVFEKLDSFRGDSTFSSWLYRVTLNSAFMKLREKKGSTMVSLEDALAYIEDSELSSSLNWPSGPDDELITEEVMKIIGEAMEKMPEDFRVVLILRDIEGFSNEETGEILDVSVPAVKSRLHRARLFLRKRLDEFYRQHMQE